MTKMFKKPVSYASISEKKHPFVKEFTFSENNYLKPKTSDLNIISEIITFLDTFNYRSSSGTGEWNYLEKKQRAEFLYALNKREINNLNTLFKNMFRNSVTYGYMSPSFKDCKDIKERIISQILCDIDTAIELAELKDISELYTKLDNGNPYGLKIDKNIILPDTPRHFYYAYKIKKFLHQIPNPYLMEIGSGFGGLSKYLMKNIKGLTCFILIRACIYF